MSTSVQTIILDPHKAQLQNHYILICNYANEAKSEDFATSTHPTPFALFAQQFTNVLPMCRRSAMSRRFCSFGVHLGERGDFRFFPSLYTKMQLCK